MTETRYPRAALDAAHQVNRAAEARAAVSGLAAALAAGPTKPTLEAQAAAAVSGAQRLPAAERELATALLAEAAGHLASLRALPTPAPDAPAAAVLQYVHDANVLLADLAHAQQLLALAGDAAALADVLAAERVRRFGRDPLAPADAEATE
jgi:hypothetical protein